MKKLVASGIALALLATAACGRLQERPQPVIVLRDGAANGAGGAPDKSTTELRRMKEFVDLYFEDGAITRDGLGNLMTSQKERLGPFLSGAKLTQAELIELLFRFDDNRDGRLTLEETQRGLTQRIPIFKWFDSNEEKIAFKELEQRIAREYPAATLAGRAGLVKVLARFDERWAGGNADGLLTRSELATAGLIMAVLAQTDYLAPSVAPKDAESRMVEALLDQKIDQQILLRYNVRHWRKLGPADITLEWMQFGVRFYLIDKLTHHFNAKGLVPDNAQSTMIRVFGIPGGREWTKLRKLYDSARFGGNADGSLNAIEAFGLLTDLDYARGFVAALGGDVTAKKLAACPWRGQLFAGLQTLFPRIGKDLYAVKGAARAEYWDGLRLFDTVEDGGDGNGKLDAGELALALNHARVVEVLFDQYDSNRDAILTRAEATPMFRSLGVNDKRVEQAFFADMGLDGKGNKVWLRIKAFFNGSDDIDELSPYEFYRRLIKVMPMLLGKSK